jgi:toxin ParE1/3/4
VSGYRLSRRADADVRRIADTSLEQWGIAQARTYRAGLARLFDDLALNPKLGQSAAVLRPGLRRVIYQSHVVLYRIERDQVFIVRVLHARMDIPRHL